MPTPTEVRHRDADALVTSAVRALLANEVEKADELLCRVLASFPDYAQAHALRGAAAHRRGNPESAREHLERAIEADGASSPEHLCNLAAILGELGRLDEAERHLRCAITHHPAHVEARVNLGMVLMQTGRHEEALTHFDRVVALKPDLAHAHRQASVVLKTLGRSLEALQAILRLRALVPDDADAALVSAQLMRDLGDAPGSVTALREAVALRPNAPAIRMELLFTLRQLCAWEEAAPLVEELIRSRSSADLGGWVAPFFELSLPISPERLQRDAQKHVRDVAGHITPRAIDATPLAEGGSRRLRVGYVSADFREHPLPHLMKGFFREHDRSAVEVFLYSIGPDDGSPYRKVIEQSAEHFVDLAPLDVDACVARIREDAIDVLVDLMGHTLYNRFPIFAHRCAPLQATYMGFAGTLGADCIDYQIVDQTVVPPELAPFYTERLVYLPDTYMATDDEQVISTTVVTRAECDLPEDGAVVFACFNVPQKIEPEVFASWMRIIKRVSGSVLWLLAMPEATRAQLRAFAAAHGVDPKRLIFAPRWKKAPHLARLRLADVALDTFLFGAHTTAVDALWAGLPVVTCPGKTFASRVGASVLQAIGLPELVAADHDAYEALAIRLAEHPAEREELRRRLAENRSTHPLFDTRRFTRHFERALLMMHEAAVSGPLPAMIEVPRAPTSS